MKRILVLITALMVVGSLTADAIVLEKSITPSNYGSVITRAIQTKDGAESFALASGDIDTTFVANLRIHTNVRVLVDGVTDSVNVRFRFYSGNAEPLASDITKASYPSLHFVLEDSLDVVLSGEYNRDFYGVLSTNPYTMFTVEALAGSAIGDSTTTISGDISREGGGDITDPISGALLANPLRYTGDAAFATLLVGRNELVNATTVMSIQAATADRDTLLTVKAHNGRVMLALNQATNEIRLGPGISGSGVAVKINGGLQIAIAGQAIYGPNSSTVSWTLNGSAMSTTGIVMRHNRSGIGYGSSEEFTPTWNVKGVAANGLTLQEWLDSRGNVIADLDTLGVLTLSSVIVNSGTVIGADFAGINVDGSAAITVGTVQVWEQMSTYDTDMPEAISDGAHGTDSITLGGTGVYEVSFYAAASAGGTNKDYEFDAFEITTTTSAVGFATVANPVVISSVAHGLSDGDHVKITGVGGMTELNNHIYMVAASTDSTYALDADDGTDINGGAYTPWTSAGTAALSNELNAVHTERRFAVNGDVGAFSAGGLVSVTLGNAVEMWFICTTDATTLTVLDSSFYINRKN